VRTDLSRIAKLVRRDPGDRSPRPGVTAAKRTMAVVSVAVVCCCAPGATPAGAAQGATVASLQAAASAAGARVRALTVQYQQDSTAATVLASEVRLDQERLAGLRQQLAATRRALQEAAIVDYTGGPVTGVPVELSAGRLTSTRDPAIRAEYLAVATGDVSSAMNAYRGEELRVAAAERSLAGQLRAASAAVSATLAARDAAMRQAAAVQASLQQAEAQLRQAQALAAAAIPSGPPQGLVAVVRSTVGPSPAPAGGVWLELRECESGDNYRENTGNGFYGAYQFSQSTWSGLGYPGRPDLEPPAMQDQAAQRLQAESGWGQWPACAAALGLT